MPFNKRYKKPYEQPPPSPIEISFWETAKPLIPELEKEVWIDRKYRVDFLIPSKKVIIELYGFQYHNTKDKITKDAERERYLQRVGYRVIRFTGTEIYKDVQKCVNEVMSLANIQSPPKVTEPSLAKAFGIHSVSKVGSQQKSVDQLLNTSSPIIRKKGFLGMERWQVATLGAIIVIWVCAILFFAALVLSGSLS